MHVSFISVHFDGFVLILNPYQARVSHALDIRVYKSKAKVKLLTQCMKMIALQEYEYPG